MHVLVAGGAGYIGSVVVPLLLERGHRVTVLDRMYFGDPFSKLAGDASTQLAVVRGDIRSVDPRLLDGIDAVIDLAGISNDPSCELEPELTRSINVDGGKRLARLASKHGVRRYVYSSSCSVYGHGEDQGLTEESPRRPVSLYAKAKVEVEDYLLGEVAVQSEMDVCVLRLATVFGLSSRMRFDLAVNVMTKNAYVNRRISVDGGGRQWRPFVHVRDAAAAFVAALEAGRRDVAREVLNVGSTTNNVRILNLAFRVRDAIPGTEVVLAPTDPDLRDYHVVFDKLHRTLGHTATYSVDDGILEVLGALKQGLVDPDDRRCYTLKQYVFLREAERVFSSLSLEGSLLTRS